MNFIYIAEDNINVSVSELSIFLKKMDDYFFEPISNRVYFASYESLAEKFIKYGKIIICRNEFQQLIGITVFYADSKNYDYAYETYIGVLKDYNGLGIGTQLMKMEIDICNKIGMKGLMTNCNKLNSYKITLNKKLGFIEIIDKNDINELMKVNSKWANKLFFKFVF